MEDIEFVCRRGRDGWSVRVSAWGRAFTSVSAPDQRTATALAQRMRGADLAVQCALLSNTHSRSRRKKALYMLMQRYLRELRDGGD